MLFYYYYYLFFYALYTILQLSQTGIYKATAEGSLNNKNVKCIKKLFKKEKEKLLKRY